MQETWIQSLIREDPKACAAQLLSLCSGAREVQQLCACTTTAEARVPQSPCLATGGDTAVRSLCTCPAGIDYLAVSVLSPRSSLRLHPRAQIPATVTVSTMLC